MIKMMLGFRFSSILHEDNVVTASKEMLVYLNIFVVSEIVISVNFVVQVIIFLIARRMIAE